MQTIQRSTAVFLLTLMGSAIHAGCGGAPMKDAEHAPLSPTSLSDDVANLDYNESLIAQAFGYPQPAPPPPPPSPTLSGGADSTPGTEAAGAPPVTPSEAPAREPRAEQLKAGESEGVLRDPCAIACRALASMTRSAQHICELSDDGERCTRARARVSQAKERVRAHCTACAEADE